MSSYHDSFRIETGPKPEFHNVTSKVKEIVKNSQIKNGIAVVFSQHTTCSILIQEESHDKTDNGTKFLFQDLLDILETIIPRCQRNGQYLHPGSEHINYVVNSLGESEKWSLNTDAHLRSPFFGRSESIPILDGNLVLGKFGQIYFADFDGVRARSRVVHTQIVG